MAALLVMASFRLFIFLDATFVQLMLEVFLSALPMTLSFRFLVVVFVMVTWSWHQVRAGYDRRCLRWFLNGRLVSRWRARSVVFRLHV